MKKLVVIGMIIGFLYGCGDNPVSTAELKLPDDLSVKASGSVYVLVNARVYDPEQQDLPLNGVKVKFVCMACEFKQLGDGVSETNIVQWYNDAYVEKRTDGSGVASIWVEVSSGISATVTASLENGAGDDMRIEVQAP